MMTLIPGEAHNNLLQRSLAHEARINGILVERTSPSNSTSSSHTQPSILPFLQSTLFLRMSQDAIYIWTLTPTLLQLAKNPFSIDGQYYFVGLRQITSALL